MSKPILLIQSTCTFPLVQTGDIRKYLHMRITQIEQKFINGVMEQTNTYYELKECEEQDFLKSEYHTNFWETYVKGSVQYCSSSPDIYLQGTRDSKIYKRDTAFFIYEFLKCTEETRLEGYPECAP